MAVAGLHNVSAFSPSIFRESRPSNRASSVLQMWRELEGDNVVSPRYRSRQQVSRPGSECFSSTTSVGQRSENGDDNSEDANVMENQGVTSEADHEDNNSIFSEQSSDLGDHERERVRQIFREWMSSSGKDGSSDRFHLGSQWRGGSECDRVRITKEWAQMNIEQRNSSESFGDGTGDVGSQIEQVRHDIGGRRPIRRLCGRQTLLDLLLRAQAERERELQLLSERRPVSDFTHRNRIQALLRGRFLINQRLVPEEKPSATAATELCLLKQRTVSDLREGFLSKLDNPASTSINTAESDSAFGDEINDETESPCREGEIIETHPPSHLESDVDGNRSLPEWVGQVSEVPRPLSTNERTEQEPSLELGSAVNMVGLVIPEATYEHMNATVHLPLATNDTAYSGGPLEVSHEHFERQSDYVCEPVDHTRVSNVSVSEEFNLPNTSTDVEEFQESPDEVEDSAWQQLTSVAFTGWADDERENMDISLQELSTDHWVHEPSGTNVVDQDHAQESRDEWPAHDLQEAIDSWLEMPSGQEDSSAGRNELLYFPDDDNVRSVEIRELFSRRRVSGLLRSSFRDSLDQVLQSLVERQGHSSADWELESTSFSPALPEQDQEQVNGGVQTLPLPDDSDINLFAPSSSLLTAAEPLWREYLQGVNWPQSLDHQSGTEWEVINELRINLAGLHQRMNSMQSMLEACMEMQIELQRTVRQEVSAALNRSVLSRDADASKGGLLNDESRWDQVRRGICCLCSDSNIDSLLYRCGHICTCSKCAEKLVECMGKCPMCQAPVVEMVRAYFTQ